MRTTTAPQLDPLYVIFEEHLYNFHDAEVDRKAFVQNIVQDYLKYMRKLNVIVPRSLESQVVDELSQQVSTMLIKKIYGFLTIEQFQKKTAPPLRKRAHTRYKKMTSDGAIRKANTRGKTKAS